MFIGERKDAVAPGAPEAGERQDPSQLRLLHLSVQQASELAALRDALRGLGFRPERVVEAWSMSGGQFWLAKALSGVSVAFDVRRLREGDPSVSPVAIAEAQSWFEGLRDLGPEAQCAGARCAKGPMRAPTQDRRRA